MIGGYESTWLADLAMAFLLEMINQNVLNKTKYFGINRNDGIAVFPGTWMQTEVEDWLLTFQRAINNKAGNNK
jgi:predicted lipase